MSTRRLTLVGVASLCVLTATLIFASAPALAATEYAEVSSFGSGGALPAAPFGLAVDQATGDVLVADQGSVRRFVPVSRSSPVAGYTSGSPLSGSFSFAAGVGIDNSGGPSQGEVYVADAGEAKIDKFDASGLADATTPQFGGGATPLALTEPLDAAVDPSNGDVYVSDYANNVIDVYEPTGGFLTQFATGSGPEGLAFNSTGSGLYVVAANVGQIEELDASGNPVIQTSGPNAGTNLVDSSGSAQAVAVDPTTNDVYVKDGGSVGVYDSSGGPLSPPGFQTGISISLGMAVDISSNAVYVPDAINSVVDVFQLVTLPEVTTGAASSVTETSATLTGAVEPDGVQITSCRFEYGTSTSYGHTAPCSELPGSGKEPVQVHADVESLEPGTTYHYRLDANNASGASPPGQDETFTTPSKPIVEGESFSEVRFTSATVSAHVNAEGHPTNYTFEYGTTEAYGSRSPIPSVSLGAARGGVTVSVELSGLLPNTLYHFRVLATSELGTTAGGDVTFTTFSVGASGLPDGRVFEMVTPLANQDANVYAPNPNAIIGGSGAIMTLRPFQASTGGNAVAYIGDPTSGGNGSSGNGGGNEYLATRSPIGGWTSVDIQPSGYNRPLFQAFSSDLSVGILQSSEPLSGDAPGGGYQVLYSHATGDRNYHALFTTTPPHRSVEEFGVGNDNQGGFPNAVTYAGASGNLGHMLFEANDTLTANAVDGGKEENNLYDSVDGQLHLVNVLPNGASEANASFGAPPPSEASTNPPDFSNVISTDGSRIFWTDVNTGILYVRENGTITVPVSMGPALFWTATPDGRYAFYAEGGRLLRFDIESKSPGETREDIAGEGADVQGVIGASENGEYVYFVAQGILTTAENGEKEKAKSGQDNLYVYEPDLGSPGQHRTTFVATLLPIDNEEGSASDLVGDWRLTLGHRTAEVAPDGHGLVFMSRRALTGYANENLAEVFVYEAKANRLFCASCDPSGEAPSVVETNNHLAAYLPVSHSNTYLPHWISEDGSRTFFDSPEPLVPQDTNGKQDVYEWERAGMGGCQDSQGCVYLLSGGESTDASYLIDASESGDDVFVVTRAQLVPRDQNDNFDLYDARVDGVQQLSPPACSEAGCQGVPPAPPIFATPASGTFNGVGNFAPLKAQVRHKSRSRKCRKGFVRKRGKCTRKKGTKPKISKGRS